jgi:peptidoglycan/LPS O-acetylase OafA/YrhL
MGTVIGALFFYYGACTNFPLISETPWWKMLLLLLLGCTMLPALTSWDIRGWAETNSLNGPTWSLLFEYIANILYALFIRRFSKTLLTLFVIVAAFFTIDLTMNLDTFHLLSDSREAAYTVIGGWSITPEQLYIGFTRLLYPFFAGLLLSRLHKFIKIRGGFWWCSLLITILLVMPRLGGAEKMWINGAYEACCILCMFPLIVAMGAGSEIKGSKSIAVCTFLGEISYPLYITHYPLIYMHIAWASQHPDASTTTIVCISIATFILAIGIAYACLKLYDLPIREWLKRHWLMS